MMGKEKSAWDGIDNVGNDVRKSVHKSWANSEMEKARGQSGWLGLAGNELLDAGAYILDGSSVNTDPKATRYRLIEKAKRTPKGERMPNDADLLLTAGKLPGDR